MYGKIVCFLLVTSFYNSLAYSLPFHRECSKHEVEKIKREYKEEILDEAEDLEDISEIVHHDKKKVSHKLKDLEKEVKWAKEFAHDKGFDIEECLNFDYINEIPNVVNDKMKIYDEEIRKRSDHLHAYVNKALQDIDKCAKSHHSCKDIERCAKKVEDHFDDDVIEDGVEDIERYSRNYVKSVTNSIDEEIDIIRETTHQCYLEHLATTESPTTTTTKSPTTEPEEGTSTVI